MAGPTPAGPAGPTPPTPSRLDRFERWFDRMESVPEGERSPALMSYIARTEVGIDLVALCTIWLSVIPFTAELRADRNWWLAARIVLSGIFLVDLVVRARLSARPWAYVRDHPFLILAVAFPPVRVVFSVRLVRRTFQRGNLGRFLAVAAILLANAALICWAFERDARGSTIDSVGTALWWSIVTVTTVGYGDYTPVTLGGRITAVAVMALGILTLAVVTATIASRFRDQAARADLAERLGTGLPEGSHLDAATAQRLLVIRDGIDALLGPVGAADRDASGAPATSVARSEPDRDG